MSSSFARLVVPVAGAATVGGAVALCYLRAELGDEALLRMAKTYSVAVPALAAYKFVEFAHDKFPRALGISVDEKVLSMRYEALHPIHAPLMRDMLLSLGGFNHKTGQLIASNIGGAAPEFWRKTFSPFLDALPPRHIDVVRETIEGDLGGPLESIFSSFDAVPLASASIGQVHRAVLRKDGSRVVVKVMYTDVEPLFRGDITTARFFLRVALPEHLPALDEIERQFANEFDYRREALQLARVKADIAAGGFSRVLVPSPHLAYCTRHVLVMDEVPKAERLTASLEVRLLPLLSSKRVPCYSPTVISVLS